MCLPRVNAVYKCGLSLKKSSQINSYKVLLRYKRYKRYTFLSKDMRFLPFLAVRSGTFRTNGKLLIGWCGANVRARPSTAGGSENGGGSTNHDRPRDRG